MHIIIDGYNLIRQSDELRRYERVSLEEGRKALIRDVSSYKKRKGHRVTVVFDGWVSGSPEEERDRSSGVNIIYSRKGEKADDVIKRLANERAEEIVVVTSDRDIADFVGRRGGTAVSSHQFVELMAKARTAVAHDSRDEEGRFQEDDEGRAGTKTKGPSKRLSRKKKSAMIKMRKL